MTFKGSIKRAVVTTGGTGGHIFPALAVARELMDRNPGCEVVFMGGSGPEGDLARAAGLRFVKLPARGVLGKGVKALSAPLWMSGALLKAIGSLLSFKPDVVIGFGGYAGFCPVLAARLLGKPTALHEQNSVPGQANRILGKAVRRVFASFTDDKHFFSPNKVLVTGNPVRKDITQVPGKTAWTRNMLVLGGSQGAQALNRAVIEALPELDKAGVCIKHQAGKANEQEVHNAYEDAGFGRGEVFGFMDNMAAAYAWADVVVCRAGASTVFEVAAAGRPAVFVPFPHATHDHQKVNALRMVEARGGMILEQKNLNGTILARTVTELLDNGPKIQAMAEAARSFARPDAAARIAGELETMCATKARAA